MSFTALHPDAGRLDATHPELGCGLDWSSIYKVRPRILLTCPDCGYGVHAKRSPRGLCYFAHDRRRPEQPCELAGESMEHHLLKLQLATSIRESGWHAELEVSAPDGTWRADVMASSPDAGRRIAWEAQLSTITVDDIQARTERYDQAGIDSCWVTTRKAVAWMGQVPSVRVAGDDGSWQVTDGVAGFDARAGWWEIKHVPLTDFVAWVHQRSLAPRPVLPRYRRVRRPSDKDFARRPVLWTTQRSAQAQERHEQMRRHQDERKKEWQEQQAALERQRQEQAAEQKRLLDEREAAWRAREDRRRQLRAQHASLQLDLDNLIRRGRWAVARQRAEHEREQLRLTEETEQRARQEQEAADLAAGQAWWGLLSARQQAGLDEAVTEAAWKELTTRVEINTRQIWPQYAYGKVARVGGRHQGTFGILRPCPDLIARSPELHKVRIFVRNAREARLLAEAGLAIARITHFDLPDFEQNTLC
ncbi:competence protein CoiA family protein [Kitasatospora sp. NPDC006697]|uniref:competence protein CoiA n=1 Tax=Kitasatospora sp. NPDC006697 TaxID=3364020 RepID=UPI00368EB664